MFRLTAPDLGIVMSGGESCLVAELLGLDQLQFVVGVDLLDGLMNEIKFVEKQFGFLQKGKDLLVGDEVRLRSVLCFIVRRVPVWVVFVRNPGLSDGRGKWKAIVLFGRLLRQENMRHFAEVFQRGA